MKQPKTKKNVDMDIVGDKMGRIHTGKQDLNKLQSRKMKGLKRGADEESGDEDEDMTLVDEDFGSESEVEEEAPKKKKKARKD